MSSSDILWMLIAHTVASTALAFLEHSLVAPFSPLPTGPPGAVLWVECMGVVLLCIMHQWANHDSSEKDDAPEDTADTLMSPPPADAPSVWDIDQLLHATGDASLWAIAGWLAATVSLTVVPIATLASLQSLAPFVVFLLAMVHLAPLSRVPSLAASLCLLLFGYAVMTGPVTASDIHLLPPGAAVLGLLTACGTGMYISGANRFLQLHQADPQRVWRLHFANHINALWILPGVLLCLGESPWSCIGWLFRPQLLCAVACAAVLRYASSLTSAAVIALIDDSVGAGLCHAVTLFVQLIVAVSRYNTSASSPGDILPGIWVALLAIVGYLACSSKLVPSAPLTSSASAPDGLTSASDDESLEDHVMMRSAVPE